MSCYGVQVTLIFILTFVNTQAKKPPGYIAPPKEYDPDPPKYEYGYRIQEEKVTHGKDEQRDGIYAQGRYYVEKGTESSQNVKYFADDWGYHPVVEYSNTGPYSKSSTTFVLGEEAIKLKNNQKSIPQDASDPGKAENLAKLNPSDPNQPLSPQYLIQDSPTLQQPSSNQLQLLEQQPQQLLIENLSEKPTIVQPLVETQNVIPEDSSSYQQPQFTVQQPQVEIYPTSPQSQIYISNKSTNSADPAANDDLQSQLIELEDPHTLLLQNTARPETIQPNLITQTNPYPQSESSSPESTVPNIPEEVISSNSQPEIFLNDKTGNSPNQPQPLFYYVQPQKGQSDLGSSSSVAEKQLLDQSFQSQLYIQSTGAENVKQQQPQQIVHYEQVVRTLPQNQQYVADQNGVLQLQEENLPQPQALIYQGTKQNPLTEDQNNPTGSVDGNGKILTHNDIAEITGESGQVLETAALTKTPNKIVENSYQYKEFGAKLNPKTLSHSNTRNLIESTKNLVTGVDVLNINAAISSNGAPDEEIETGTIQSLLNQYITPTILDKNVNVDINHVGIVSATTLAPPVTTIGASLLKEPIVVAESQEDLETKPVTEKTAENKEYFFTTSRSSLVSSTTIALENLDGSSEEIVVTPRPVSSKFLAPITAGVQLQHIEEPIFEDSQTIEAHEEPQKKENVLVQVQKTIPYYLGMYQYPSAYAAQYIGHNLTEKEKAAEDIELGKTLLYFPDQERPKAEQLVQGPKLQQSQGVSEITSNHLTVQQLPSVQIKQKFAETDQLAVQGEQQLYIQKAQAEQESLEQVSFQSQQEKKQHQQGSTGVTKIVHHTYPIPYPVIQRVPIPQPYPVEKIVDRPVHIPVEVTKYVDRPYRVEVPVPYPQPYPVEKVVKEPYAVPVHIEVPVPHPVPVEKVVERKVHVPYYIEKPVEKPVEKIVERKIPVPYYIEKPKVVEQQVPQYTDRPYPVGVPVQNQVQHGYLLQIPGLFTQQRYSNLVHNTYQPQKLKFEYRLNANQNKNLGQYQYSIQHPNYRGMNPYSYAPQINQYLPSQQNHVKNDHMQQRLKKLNLLIFPGVKVPVNLPPITKNPFDLQQSQSFESFRHSNAQLDNQYLPPVQQQRTCDHSDHSDHLQVSSSNVNNYNIVKQPEEHIGLIPPRRHKFEDDQKYRKARSQFDDKSIRLEYGFMPPLIPSLEIDEQGQPIEKDDNKK